MSAPAPRRSPRSAENPMAFTPGELWRGAGFAWCAFMILLAGGFLIAMVVDMVRESTGPEAQFIDVELMLTMNVFLFMMVLLVGGAIGIVVAAVGALVTHFLGRALRRIRPVPIHLLVYGALGAIIGGLAVWIMRFDEGAFWTVPPYTWIIALSATLAVPLGWWISARLALRPDHRAADPLTQLGDDERFEDSVR